jgi:hypothetical protein
MRAAVQANQIYATRLRQEQQEERSRIDGTGPDGRGSAYDSHAACGCLMDLTHTLSDKCSRVVNDIAAAMVDATYCSKPASRDNVGCRVMEDWRLLAEEHPEILADLLQMTLMACGRAPIVGEMCDLLNAVVSASRGDWVGTVLSLGSMVPIAGWGATAAQAAMNADKYREALKYVAILMRGCPGSRFASAMSSPTAAGRFEPTDSYYVPDDTVIVRGGQGDFPGAGTRFSGAMGRSVTDAGGAVPDGSIRVTTAGAIRAAGGTVEYAPDEGRNGWMNYKHVNVTLGGGNPFSEVRSNPVPRGGRMIASTLGVPCH